MGTTHSISPPSQLIAAAEQEQVTQNAARARQLQVVYELYLACGEDPTELGPSGEAAIEIAGVLGLAEVTVQIWIDTYQKLTGWLPCVWALCLSGRLDLHKARVFLDAAETLADDQERELFHADVERYLARRDDPTTPVVRLRRSQLQNAARFRALKRKRKPQEETFSDAFAKRRVWLRHDEHGIACFGVRTAAHDLVAADYRLTLIAKKRCQDDDQGRTLEQMRADTLVDLIVGRLEVTALNADLEADETADGEDPGKTFTHHDLGAFARPVVNVTVPIGTLLGLDDDPALLSGDHPIPAEVARHIAGQPGSTWHRLLTDEAGRFMELSTTSYAPTKAIWRSDVARDRSCIWPGCGRPSVLCEIDHRIPYPHGPTDTENTGPLCKKHHRAKHSTGYSLTRDDDGTYVVRTRHGTVFREAPGDQLAS